MILDYATFCGPAKSPLIWWREKSEECATALWQQHMHKSLSTVMWDYILT